MNPKELIDSLDQCVRCGKCMSVCPVYKETGWEGSVARGKLALLRADLEGGADLSGRMKDLLSHCLLCGACAETCANSVKGDELIQAGRALALQGGGLAALRSLLTKDLLARGLGAKTLWKGRRLFLKNVPPESGLHFRFPVPGLSGERRLPQPADKQFLEDLPDVKEARPGAVTVALFVGCVGNYIRPQSARAAVRLLEAAGARVVIPKKQVCCGKPAAGAGDAGTAAYLARRNIEAIGDEADHIVTFCATCSEYLKEYSHLENVENGGRIASRVRDITDLLVNELHWSPDPGDIPAVQQSLKVFYHDPCHLRRKQKIYKEPRALLKALPGIELTGEDLPPVCCGYGGIFNLWHYDLSRGIFRKRAETIEPFNPDILTTSCSGCWLQFYDQALTLRHPAEIKPLVELLAERGLAPEN